MSRLLILLLLIPGSLWAQKKFEPLYALEGRWIMTTRDGSLLEEWKRVRDARLESHSYRITGTDTILMERVVLLVDDAAIYYRPVVMNQNNGQEISFRLKRKQGHRYIFINTDHDFPKRIIYHLKSPDEMEVRIDDNRRRGGKHSIFLFKREG